MALRQQNSAEQMETVALDPSELELIAAFLTPLFAPGLPAELLSRSLLEWKLFAPRPDWRQPRSYVVRRHGEIVAHAAVWPSEFHLPAGTLRCGHLVDWAASASSAGSGVTLYQHLMRLPQVVFAIGGSAQARRLLPRIGFTPYGKVQSFARVVRPWKQFTSRPGSAGWRAVARLGRNTAWSIRALPAAGKGWYASPFPSAEPLANVLADPAGLQRFLPGRRTPAVVDYLLACPVAKYSLCAISGPNGAAGYFLLNRIGGQCRIIDMQLNTDEPEHWRMAYRLASCTAVEQPAVCEIVAATALEWLSAILEEDGYVLRQDTPVHLFDPAKHLAGTPPLHFQMVDWDAFYRYDPSFPYLT
jgi:hypothetical protein